MSEDASALTTEALLEREAARQAVVAARRRRKQRTVRIAQVLFPFVLLGGLELAIERGLIDSFFVSRPSDVAQRLWEWAEDGTMLRHLVPTLVEALSGFLIGVGIGVLVAFLFYQFPSVGAVGLPYVTALYAIPRVIIAPLFILWFGLGMQSKVVLVVLVVAVLVFFNTYAGLSEIDENLLSSLRVLGGRRRDLVRFALVPSVVVWVFSSLRVSIGLAFSAAVVAEYLGSVEGLGYLISRAQGTFDTVGVFSGLTLVSALVLVSLWLVGRLESHLLRWRRR